MLLIEAVEFLEGLVQLSRIQMIVLDGIQVSIGDFHPSVAFFDNNRVALNEKSIAQFIAYEVP